MICQSPAKPPAISFAALLRQLRAEARLTQEELAWKTGLSPRSISDLERGISRTTRPSTANVLADALALDGSTRTAFVAAARGRAPVSDVLSAREQAFRGDPASEPMDGGGEERLSLEEIKLLRKIIEAISAADADEGSTFAVIWRPGLAARGR